MNINLAAIQLLDQLEQVVDQLTPAQYTRPVDILSDSSIGQHVRHTLEFFICLMDAKNDKKLNYDLRRRDQYIEQDPVFAMSILKTIQTFIEKETLDFEIVLEANYHKDEAEVTRIKSNFLREVAYNIEHTIHHMALIKIGVKTIAAHAILPEYFGVATSTVRHHQNS